MKLEPKHLAPYLPYRLNCCLMGESDEETKKPLKFLIEGANNESVEVWSRKTITDEWSYEDVFPILRPLSDLTDRINPIQHHTYLDGLSYSKIDFVEKAICNETLLLCDYNYLIEYHFDVFGLIEQGLAIDINTLNND